MNSKGLMTLLAMGTMFEGTAGFPVHQVSNS